jgi:hypothetical protein
MMTLSSERYSAPLAAQPRTVVRYSDVALAAGAETNAWAAFVVARQKEKAGLRRPRLEL